MARSIDWALFEKAVDMSSMALRGAMGGENSQPPKYAAEVFNEVWGALKKAAEDIPERGPAGFGG